MMEKMRRFFLKSFLKTIWHEAKTSFPTLSQYACTTTTASHLPAIVQGVVGGLWETVWIPNDYVNPQCIAKFEASSDVLGISITLNSVSHTSGDTGQTKAPMSRTLLAIL